MTAECWVSLSFFIQFLDKVSGSSKSSKNILPIFYSKNTKIDDNNNTDNDINNKKKNKK